MDEAGLAGEWELVYSDVELFRSSPFFLAIEVLTRRPAQAGRRGPPRTAVTTRPALLHCAPTTAGGARRLARHPSAGQVARADRPTKKSALFFKLHQLQASCRQRTAPHPLALAAARRPCSAAPAAPPLQRRRELYELTPRRRTEAAALTRGYSGMGGAVRRSGGGGAAQVLSWGTSTVGRIAQRLDFEAGLLESSFDTIIFGLTVVPLLGWGKLLPTFGGRVLTEADRLTLEGDELVMELQRTKVLTCPGVARLPLLDGVFMDRWCAPPAPPHPPHPPHRPHLPCPPCPHCWCGTATRISDKACRPVRPCQTPRPEPTQVPGQRGVEAAAADGGPSWPAPVPCASSW